MNTLLIEGLAIALLCIFITLIIHLVYGRITKTDITLKKNREQIHKLQSKVTNYQETVTAQRVEQAALVEMQKSLTAQIAELHEALNGLRDTNLTVNTAQNKQTTHSYQLAAKLLDKGLAVEDVVTDCAISQGEAALLAKLQQYRQAA